MALVIGLMSKYFVTAVCGVVTECLSQRRSRESVETAGLCVDCVKFDGLLDGLSALS